MKKGLSILLCFVMLFSMTAVFADEVAGTTAANTADSVVSETAETDATEAEAAETEEPADGGIEDPVAPEEPKAGVAETEETKIPETGEAEEEAPSGKQNTSNKVIVDFRMLPRMQVIDSFAKVELSTADGKVLGEKVEWVGGITENLHFEFDVPEYTLGESFILTLKDGLSYIKYYEDTYRKDEKVKLDTYGYTDENGEFVVGNSFALDGCPMYEHVIVVYVEGKQMTLTPKARLIGNTAMVPARAVAEAIGLDVRYDERYRSVVCEIDGKQALFNLDTNYATLLGTDTYLPSECVIIDGSAFVPARSLAEAFGCEVTAIDFEDHIDVCIGESPIVKEYMQNIPVNKLGISSRTNYLVWVDKSDFRVRVYTGSQYKWKQAASFPCTIGAPGTPTITGSFEYQYKVSRWTYPQYYVGPCLVFYGGYALHSTLQRYDGTPYDDRVEHMLSLGCVRLHKADIDWIADRLPIGSRIYVTE